MQQDSGYGAAAAEGGELCWGAGVSNIPSNLLSTEKETDAESAPATLPALMQQREDTEHRTGAAKAQFPLCTPMHDIDTKWLTDVSIETLLSNAGVGVRPPLMTPGSPPRSPGGRAGAAAAAPGAGSPTNPHSVDVPRVAGVEMAEWPAPPMGRQQAPASVKASMQTSFSQMRSQSPQSTLPQSSLRNAEMRSACSASCWVASPRAAAASAPGVPPPPADEAHVVCVINGLLTVRFPLNGSLEVPVPADLRINGDGASLYAQCVAFSTESTADQLEPNQQVRVSIAFQGAGTHRREMFIGFLSKDVRHCSATHFVPFLPETAVVSCAVVGAAQTDADEERFCVEVRRIFLASTVNPMAGSLPSALAQNHAKILPLYDTVIMQCHQGSWHGFLRAHPKDFVLYQLTHAEIMAEQLMPWVKPNEMRVALAGTNPRRADSQRAAAYRSHEARLIKFLETILAGIDGLDQREVMEHLGDNTDFLHFATPSYSAMARFLLQHREKFVWSSHPNLVATIGLGRGQRVADVPRLRGGRGVATLSLQQQRQQAAQPAHGGRAKYRGGRSRRSGPRDGTDPPQLVSWNGDTFSEPQLGGGELPGTDRWGGQYQHNCHDQEQYTMQ